MRDGEYTGWPGGNVVRMLGDNGVWVALLHGVEGMGWQQCGVVTVQDKKKKNEEEG